MQTNYKLLRLLLIGLFFCVTFTTALHAQNNSCETAIDVEFGDNNAPNTPNWYAFTVPTDMQRLTLSSLGKTTLDTYVEVYSECGGSRIFYNDDSDVGRQSYLDKDVSRYQGETLYIRWRLFSSSTEGNFDWTLGGTDINSKPYSHIVSIDDIVINYGVQLKIENNNNPIDSLHFMLVGEDNGVITLQNDSIIGLSVAGTQQVVGVIYDEYSVNRGQQEFTVTNQVDPSGKKTGVITNLEDIVIHSFEDYELQGATNSSAEISYAIISGSEYASISGNVLTAEAYGEVEIEASIIENDEYTASSVIFTVSISPYKNGILYEEYLALEALYNTTDGPNWNNNTNWLTDEPIEDWYGVTTSQVEDENGTTHLVVTQISFSNNSLKGNLPSELGNLIHLTSLNLSYNSLVSVPLELGNLVNLTGLYLSSNSLVSIPVELGNLVNLTELNLSYNSLVSVPLELGNLVHLISLDLSRNSLESVPVELGNLVNLTELNLSYNSLVSVPVELGNLSNLTSLILSSNSLESVPLELGNLLNLTSLNLSYNSLESVPVELGNLSNLTYLSLYSNSLLSVPVELGNLVNLTNLYLHSNSLVNVPVELGNLVNLTTLFLHSNSLESVPVELGNLVNLTYLDLSYTSLLSVPVELGNLVNLTRLNLSSNSLESIPLELGNLLNLTTLDIDYNRFTFEKLDLQKDFFTSISSFDYSPQNNILINRNQDVELLTTILTIPDTAANNSYEWYKDGEVMPNETTSILTINYTENLDSEFYCKITNTDWPDLTLQSTTYTEKGELISLIVNNIPSNTPENTGIYAIGSFNNNNYRNQEYPLVYNTTNGHYALTVPKNLGTVEFRFALKNHEGFVETNIENEEVLRTLELTELSGEVIIDDISAWLSIPTLPNTCNESIPVFADSTNLFSSSPTYYSFIATEYSKITVATLDADKGSSITIYDGCDGTILFNRRNYYENTTGTLELIGGQEIIIKVSNYTPDRNSVFNWKLEARPLIVYTVASIPENTPEDMPIYAIGTMNELDYTNQDYPLRKVDGGTSYELVVEKELGEVDFTFVLKNHEDFSEVIANGDFVTRTIDTTTDSEVTLAPIIGWNMVPELANTCASAIELTTEGDYIVGTAPQWYSFTATEDMQLSLSSLDARYVTGAELNIYNDCDGTLLRREYNYYSELSVDYDLKQGETIYFQWDSYYTTNANNFKWNLSTHVTKTYVVNVIPESTPENMSIYAIGSMNNYDYSNQDYELIYNDVINKYELIFPEELDTVRFHFVLKNYEEFREVNNEGDTISRFVDVANTTTNTQIEDIISWGNIPQLAYTCTESLEITADTLIAGGIPTWYHYEASTNQVITLSTLGLTPLDTRVRIYDNCDGEELAYNDDAENTVQTKLEYTLSEGDNIKIKWDLFGSGDKPFKWSFEAVDIEHQTLDSLNVLLKSYSQLELLSDQELPLNFELISGNATIEDDVLTINGGGELTLRFYNEGDLYHYALDTTATVTIDKLIQNFDFTVFDEISTTGLYQLESYNTEEALSLSLEAVSDNAEITNDSLNITSSGEVQLRIFNEGDGVYHPFDSTYTFTVDKSIITFNTSYFEDIEEVGSYLLPSFISDQGVVLSLEVVSGSALITGDSLFIIESGAVELNVVYAGDTVYESFSRGYSLSIAKSVLTFDTSYFEDIEEVGSYLLPSFISDQGVVLSLEVVSGSALITGDSLFIIELGAVELNVVYAGDTVYESFSRGYSLSIAKSVLTFDTSYFEDIEEVGSYLLPSFISDQGVVLSLEVVSGAAIIEEDSLKVISSGEVELSLTYKEDNVYEGFSNSYILQINEVIPTGLENELSKSISIYPNPANKEVFIEVPNVQAIGLTVVSTTGQLIHKEQVLKGNNYRNVLDVSTFKTGVYVLIIQTEKGNGIKRLIVK
ncbi:T9SS type A sorting domain-containing protein [Flammeovirga pectinis]|uniref:T9SS type A sorting domain-containing protein n=1 Tax=Flammeovirga pectinis TaxID=2494373 RepID=A0A3Q9FQW1_9BACT|nr:T9SS type A sorting domain-containing protein [Flammeovirga pectinis]AZQ64983.1 T9SS type A sorting domain-containing protein [Flammeovirga pectinis]